MAVTAQFGSFDDDTPYCTFLDCGPHAVCKPSNFGFGCKCKRGYGGHFSSSGGCIPPNNPTN